MPTCLAITATHDNLIVHEFETEQEALKAMPYIRAWSRETAWLPKKIRYHSKKAEQYWKNRLIGDSIKTTRFIYKNGEKKTVYE